MRFSVRVNNDLSFAELTAVAVAAEQAGFGQPWFSNDLFLRSAPVLAGALITDEALDRFAFAGTPERVAALAQRVLDAGADRVEFGTPHGLTDDGGVALLGTAVLPALRR